MGIYATAVQAALGHELCLETVPCARMRDGYDNPVMLWRACMPGGVLVARCSYRDRAGQALQRRTRRATPWRARHAQRRGPDDTGARDRPDGPLPNPRHACIHERMRAPRGGLTTKTSYEAARRAAVGDPSARARAAGGAPPQPPAHRREQRGQGTPRQQRRWLPWARTWTPNTSGACARANCTPPRHGSPTRARRRGPAANSRAPRRAPPPQAALTQRACSGAGPGPCGWAAQPPERRPSRPPPRVHQGPAAGSRPAPRRAPPPQAALTQQACSGAGPGPCGWATRPPERRPPRPPPRVHRGPAARQQAAPRRAPHPPQAALTQGACSGATTRRIDAQETPGTRGQAGRRRGERPPPQAALTQGACSGATPDPSRPGRATGPAATRRGRAPETCVRARARAAQPAAPRPGPWCLPCWRTRTTGNRWTTGGGGGAAAVARHARSPTSTTSTSARAPSRTLGRIAVYTRRRTFGQQPRLITADSGQGATVSAATPSMRPTRLCHGHCSSNDRPTSTAPLL